MGCTFTGPAKPRIPSTVCSAGGHPPLQAQSSGPPRNKRKENRAPFRDGETHPGQPLILSQTELNRKVHQRAGLLFVSIFQQSTLLEVLSSALEMLALRRDQNPTTKHT